MVALIKTPPLNTTFPCLMEYRIQGSVPVGIFLVSKELLIGQQDDQDDQDDQNGKSIDQTLSSFILKATCIAPYSGSKEKIGNTYEFSHEILNNKEWRFLSEEISVNLLNTRL